MDQWLMWMRMEKHFTELLSTEQNPKTGLRGQRRPAINRPMLLQSRRRLRNDPMKVLPEARLQKRRYLSNDQRNELREARSQKRRPLRSALMNVFTEAWS